MAVADMKEIQTHHSTPVLVYSTQELLQRQSKGKFLTREEKQRVQRYAEETRKKRLN
jgi:hypothetical protein